MGKIIAFVNNKGGVGKTSAVVNLGHALVMKKRKVLLVDLDSQCNATGICLDGRNVEHSLYELLDTQVKTDVTSCVHPTKFDSLDVLPNVHETVTLESALAQEPDKGYGMLRSKLREHAVGRYDFTLIDCPPNLGVFVVQAILAADAVVIPIEAGSRFSIDGLERTLNAIEEVKQYFQTNLTAVRLLLSRADRRTSVCRIVSLQLRKHYGDQVFGVEIPSNTAFQQAELLRQSVLTFSPESKGAHAFQGLASEVLRSVV